MKISARNVLSAKVVDIKSSNVSAQVTLELKGSLAIVSNITASSVESLGLKKGDDASVLFKSSSVMISTDSDLGLSARNIIKGKIVNIKSENVDSEVIVDIGEGQTIVSVITTDSVNRLDLKVADDVFAVIKSTSVMVGK